ncbi:MULTISPECIES: ABC transporter permease [Halomonadaceae]|uniref:ABC transporter permease n=2 Tax=Vreelandella TaxID=3137766 RepID=A0A7Z0RX81_9GAMM|nr:MULTISPECIES: ABC transporter permease [Halomonas]AJY51627.1 ABC-type transporter, integral membrane subunit [Halomonas sp. KO116]NYS76935.1 ABC transporter permease [Halomonas glaciei]|tara:strand:- start:2394 stop:3230 length:837 start_codon:yes stop_codon:yes gene_type:complete
MSEAQFYTHTIRAGSIKENDEQRTRSSFITDNLWRVTGIGLVVVLWQIGVMTDWINPFLMGSPVGIAGEAWRLIQSGQLLNDTIATVYATVVGFLLGSILGSISGLLLWFSRTTARIIDPFMVALNGLPKIALAPMIIIWFGSGMLSKIALAFVATFVVALLSAYQGTHQIDRNLINLMRSMGASRREVFTKVVAPASLPWIISAFRLNIGFALIAEIGGEFISSDRGLGRMIFVAGNLFNLNVVWVGVITLMIVAIVLYVIVSQVEKRLLPWEQGQR